MKAPLVVAASSITAIDFTAIVIASYCLSFQESEFVCYLKGTVNLASTENRRYESRLALPTLDIAQSPGGLRQVFIPIDKIDPQEFESLLKLMTNSYARVFESRNDIEAANSVRSRGENLRLNYLSEYPYGSGVKGITSLRSILKKILNELLDNPRVSIPDFDPSALHRIESAYIKYVITILARDFLASKKQNAQLAKGGSLDVINNTLTKEGTIIDRIRNFERTSDGAVFFGEKMKINILFSNQNLTEFVSVNPLFNGEVVTRGPIELLGLSQLGRLAHIPWYCDVNDTVDEALEFISPMTTSGEKRTSANKNNMFRLLPQGYSLLDFDHIAVHRFIAAILRVSTCTYKDYSDWQEIALNLPATPEKGAKDLLGARNYCQEKLSSTRAQRHKSLNDSKEFLSKTKQSEVTLLNICSITLAAWNIVDYYCNTSNLNKSQIGIDESSLLIDFKVNILDAISAIQFAIAAINCCLDTLSHLGLRDFQVLGRSAKEYTNELEKILSFLKSSNIASLETNQAFDDVCNSKIIAQARTKLKGLYYCLVSIAVFLMNSILKANIITLYMIMQKSEVKNSINQLLKLRNGKEYKSGCPIFF